MFSIIFLASVSVLLIPVSYLLYKFLNVDKGLLIMISVMFYSIIVFSAGLIFPQAIVACGTMLEIGIIFVYCDVYPWGLRIVKKHTFKHFGTLCWYIFPSIIIYALSTYAIMMLFNDTRSLNSLFSANIISFKDYLSRINETVGFGFVVNAIFQYFNDHKESEDNEKKEGIRLKNGKK